jgi:hypothetical protein
MESCFLAWLDYFVGCCLQPKLQVMFLEHWVAASIDFAWDGTLLLVHSCKRVVALEVMLGHVHSALGNKFDESIAVLA